MEATANRGMDAGGGAANHPATAACVTEAGMGATASPLRADTPAPPRARDTEPWPGEHATAATAHAHRHRGPPAGPLRTRLPRTGPHDQWRARRIGEAQHPGPSPQAPAQGPDSHEALWHVLEQQGRYRPLCSTCKTPIRPGAYKAQYGGPHARAHHVECVLDLLPPPAAIPEAAQLPPHVRNLLDHSENHAAMDVEAAPSPQAAPCTAAATTMEADTDDGDLPFWRTVPWEALWDPVPLITGVPRDLHDVVAHIRLGALRRASDSPHDEAAWKAYFFLDRVLFTMPQKVRAGRRRQGRASVVELIAERCRRYTDGEARALWADTTAAIRARQGESHPLDDAKVAQWMRDDVLGGDMRTALRRLEPKTPVAADAEVIAQLPCLYPRTSQDHLAVEPQMVTDAQLELFCAHLAQAYADAPRRRAPGPGAATFEHYKWMPDTTAWPQYAALMANFPLGRVPAAVQDVFNSVRIIPLAKPHGGVRPIAVGMAQRRLVSRALARMARSRVAAACAPIQHAVGIPRGAELLHKSAWVALARDPSAQLATWDIGNAYGNVERTTVAAAVNAHLPEYACWLRAALAATPTLTCRLQTGRAYSITQPRGLQQGDPVSTLLFCLALRDPLRQTLQQTRRRHPEVQVWAYADDVIAAGSPAALPHMVHQLRAELLGTGMELNLAKSTLWMPPGSDPPAEPVGQLVPHARVLRTAAILGETDAPAPTHASDGPPTPTPSDPAYNALQTKRQHMCARLQRLHAAGLSTQVAVCALKALSAGDATFLARASGLPQEVIDALDHQLHNTATALLRLPPALGPDQRRQLYLPVRMGGLGLTRQGIVAPAAFEASWLQAAEALCTRFAMSSLEPIAHGCPQLRQAMKDTQAWSTALGDPELPTLDGAPARPLTQHQLLADRHQHMYEQLTQDLALPRERRAALLSAGGPGAGGFLQPPASLQETLPNDDYNVAVWRRLRLPVSLPDARCQHVRADGAQCQEPLDPYGDHALSCATGGHLVARHDAAAQTLAQWMREQLQAPVQLEQLAGNPAAKMDLAWHTAHGEPAYGDFTVASATTETALNAHHAATVPGAAAAAAERAKRHAYPQVAGFRPLAVESHGRVGQELHAVARELAPTAPAARTTALAALWRQLGATLRRQEARALRAAGYVPN